MKSHITMRWCGTLRRDAARAPQLVVSGLGKNIS